MYSLKPLTTAGDATCPDVMYRLKSYHDETPEGGDINKELQVLEQRQENILAKLRKLQAEVDELVSGSSKPSGAEGVLWQRKITPCPAFKKGEVVEDIVITADPGRPPLSLIILSGMLTKQYSVFTSSFTHSSIGALADKLKTALPASNGIMRNSAHMAISFIWSQDTPRPKLSVSRTSIEGEAAIARYLARLLKRPSSIYEADTDNLASITEQDFYLDLQSDLASGSQEARDAAFAVLKKKLSTSTFLGGNKYNLADMVLWSSLVGSSTELPAPLTSWQKRCSDLPEFQSAVKVL